MDGMSVRFTTTLAFVACIASSAGAVRAQSPPAGGIRAKLLSLVPGAAKPPQPQPQPQVPPQLLPEIDPLPPINPRSTGAIQQVSFQEPALTAPGSGFIPAAVP